MEIKRKSVENYLSQKKLYTYSNGLKVQYKKTNEPKTSIEFYFVGGAGAQGKYAGLAHLTEHSIFQSDVFTTSVLNKFHGSTNDFITKFELIVDHDMPKQMAAKDSVFEYQSIQKILQQASNQKEKTGEMTGEIGQIAKLYDIFSTFTQNLFEKINSPTLESDTVLENEKHIIDAEYQYGVKKNVPSSKSAFCECVINRTNNYIVCGNYDTLKHVTRKDIDEFKANNYTLENLCVCINTPYPYELFETELVYAVSGMAKSKPNTACKYEQRVVPQESCVYVNQDKSLEKGVDVYFAITADEKVLSTEERLIGNDLLTFLLRRYGISKRMRASGGLSYHVEIDKELNYNNLSVLGMETVIAEDCLDKGLLKIAQDVKNATTWFLDDETSHIIKNTANKVCANRVSNPIWLGDKLTRQVCDDILNKVKNASTQELKDCLQKYMENCVVNVVVSKNADTQKIPDIKHIETLVHGKEPKNHICKKGNNVLEPISANAPPKPAVIVKQ